MKILSAFLVLTCVFLSACAENGEGFLDLTLELPQEASLGEIKKYVVVFEGSDWKSDPVEIERRIIKAKDVENLPRERNIKVTAEALGDGGTVLLRGKGEFDFTAGKIGKIYLEWVLPQ